MAVEYERAEVALELPGGRNSDGRCLQARANVFESSSAQPRCRALCVGEKPRLRKLPEPGRELLRLAKGSHALPKLCEVRSSSTLCVQPSAGSQYRKEVSEQCIVIKQPVKRRRAENPIERI